MKFGVVVWLVSVLVGSCCCYGAADVGNKHDSKIFETLDKSRANDDVRGTPPFYRNGMRLENPEQHYIFGEEIGRGKMSVVKECFGKKDGRKWAAKIIRYWDDDEYSQKIAAREYEFMDSGKLHAFRLAQLHEAYLVRNYLIIIMDLAPSRTLLDFMSDHFMLTYSEVATVIREIVETLHYLHQRNLVHADIRPTNIRLEDLYDLKIVDYNSMRDVADKKKKVTADLIGDAEFCAPEVLNFFPLSTESDMWSVGVISYIILTGKSPFYDEDENKIYTNIAKVNYKFDKDDNLPSQAMDFIKKCLTYKPESRLTSSEALKHPFMNDLFRKGPLAGDVTHLMKETDDRLFSEEEEDYVEASLVFRTFKEEPYIEEEEEED